MRVRVNNHARKFSLEVAFGLLKRTGVSLMLAVFLLFLDINFFTLFGAADPLRVQQQSDWSGSVYVYKLNVISNSDWTSIAFTGGPKVLAFNVSVVQGAKAPSLRYVAQPDLISINKEPFDTTTVEISMDIIAVAGESSGNVTITKGDLGSTNLTLAFYKSGTFQPFFTLVNSGVTGGLNTRKAIIDYSTLYNNPSGSTFLHGIPSSLNHKVFAFYYPWYGNPAGPSGQWSHWLGVTKNLILSSTNYPLFGPYDSQDPAIIRAQILLARQAGIDGFISSWWGIGDFTDRSFSVLLQVAREMNFTVTIYYETVRSLTSSEMVKELSYVVTQYGSNPAFLKADGRPVIFVYAVGAYGRDAAYWLSVRKELESNVGPVYLIGDLTDISYINVFNGFHNYIQLDCSQMVRNYNFFATRMDVGLPGMSWNDALYSVEHGMPLPVERKSLFFTVIPGNDRLGANRTGGGPILRVDRQGGKTYAQCWTAAISSNAMGVLLTSWNEWHEGTELEPSREYGFAYLQYTKEWTTQYKHEQSMFSGLPMIQTKASQSVARQSLRTFDINITFTNIGSEPALFTNVTLSVSRNMSVKSLINRNFVVYFEIKGSNLYSAMIPLIMPNESLTIGVSYELASEEGMITISIRSFNAVGNSTGTIVTNFRVTKVTTTITSTASTSQTSSSTSSISTPTVSATSISFTTTTSTTITTPMPETTPTPEFSTFIFVPTTLVILTILIIVSLFVRMKSSASRRRE